MEPTKNLCHYILLYDFRKGKTQVAQKLRDVYGEKALKETKC